MTLRAADTPHVPKVDAKTFEKNLETPGYLNQRQCASHLMGALYGARMAHPGLSTAIARLTSHIIVWNAECERRLVRMFAHVETNPELVLSGRLGEQDLSSAFIRARWTPILMETNSTPIPRQGVGSSLLGSTAGQCR